MAAKNVLKLLKRFGLSFRRNWGLKLASLFFAVFLWNYVITEVNPIRTVTFRGVPVTYSENGVTLLNNSGFTIRGKPPERLIDVSVDVRRSEASQLKKDNISATVDLSGIASDGDKEVKIAVRTPLGTVRNVAPETMTVSIERMDNRIVPVEFTFQGDLPQGYWRGDPVPDNNKLKVSGASSLVKKVASARITISLTGLTGKLSAARDATLLDIDGNALDQGGLKVEPSSCIVNMDVFPTKRIPVDANSSVSGDVADGYKLAGVKADPAEILIAGPAEKLDSILSLTAKPVSLSGISASFSKSTPLILPEGVRIVGENTVTVHVTVETKMTTFTLDNIAVNVMGIGGTLKMESKLPRVTVTVTCPELLAAKIKARPAALHLTADASGLAAGSHALTVRWNPDSDLGVTRIETNPDKVLVTLAAAGGT